MFKKRNASPAPAAPEGEDHKKSGIGKLFGRHSAPKNQHYALNLADTIGRYCGLGIDWSVLDLCESLSDENGAKEAAEAIRKEIKHGAPVAQDRAARLLVIISRNAPNQHFKEHINSKKYIKTLSDVGTAKNISPAVKGVLLKALSVLTFENAEDPFFTPIRSLYNQIKQFDAPAGGLPVDEGDDTFTPGATVERQPANRPHLQHHPKSIVADILKKSSVAKSEAILLNETLSNIRPDQLASNDLVKEFWPKVSAWQDFLIQNVPWAENEVQRLTATPDNPQLAEMQTVLSAMQNAQTEVTQALTLHDYLESQHNRNMRDEEDLRVAQERSKYETKGNQDLAHNMNFLGIDDTPRPSGSGSASRSQTPLPHSTENHASNNPFFSQGYEVPDHNPAPKPPAIPSRNLLDEDDEAPQSVNVIQPIDRNPFHQDATPTTAADALSQSQAQHQTPVKSSIYDAHDRSMNTSSEPSTPLEPSAKALGKLRAYTSPLDEASEPGTEEEDLRREQEDERKLREKYKARSTQKSSNPFADAMLDNQQ